MRRFYLDRYEDSSGVSGTGRVAEGVVFEAGEVVLFWLTDHRSMGLYTSIDEVVCIHGHEGRTRVAWIDGNDGTVAPLPLPPLRAAHH